LLWKLEIEGGRSVHLNTRIRRSRRFCLPVAAGDCLCLPSFRCGVVCLLAGKEGGMVQVRVTGEATVRVRAESSCSFQAQVCREGRMKADKE
jgi:hypothetical protein